MKIYVIKAEGDIMSIVACSYVYLYVYSKNYFSAFYFCVCEHVWIALARVAWGIWAADNHCCVFLLRGCDEGQMDDKEEILEDKRQVLALQWTCKEFNVIFIFAYRMKSRSRQRGILNAADIIY